MSEPMTCAQLHAELEALGCHLRYTPKRKPGTVRWFARVSGCRGYGLTPEGALANLREAMEERRQHVEAMSAHQQCRDVHPYTCLNRGDGRHEGEGKLVATFEKWVCPSCDYTQRYW